MSIKKRSCAVLAICLALTSGLTACGGGGGGSSDGGEAKKNTLRVFVTDAGYGTQWLTDSLEAFKNAAWVKEKYPELIIAEPEKDSVTIPANKMLEGVRTNKFDILVSCQPVGMQYNSGIANFEDLSDVFYGAIPGDSNYDGTEGKQLKDKFQSESVYESQIVELAADIPGTTDKVYAMPWVLSTVQFIVNEKKYETLMGKDYVAPVTSKELIALVDEVSVKMGTSGDAPIAMSSYEGFNFNQWWAQYEGVENYENYWRGMDEEGEYSAEIFKQEGRLKALKEVEALYAGENASGKSYVHTSSYSDYFRMTIGFGAGTVGILTDHGDFLLREAGTKNPENFSFLKIPVLSALVDKCTSVKTDEQLAFVVRSIDAGKDYDTTASEYSYGTLAKVDYDYIANARGMIARFTGHEMFIPSYAANKDIAKDFLRFLATDDGIHAFESANGWKSPYKANVATDRSKFAAVNRQYHEEFDKGSYMLRANSSWRLYQMGGLLSLTGAGNNLGTTIAAFNKKDRKSAETLINADIAYYGSGAGSEFDQMLKNAGLK